MKDIIKNALILFVITLVAGVALGFVYDMTKGPIAQNKANALAAANAVVFEDAVNWSMPMLDEAAAQAVLDSDPASYANVNFKNVLEAQDASGTPLGYVIEVGSMGYGDEIGFVVGIRNEGVLNGISIISIAETPGLGMNAEPVLVPQYSTGDKAVQMYETTANTPTSDNQIQAISGATITSNAIKNGVNAAVQYYEEVLKGGQ